MKTHAAIDRRSLAMVRRIVEKIDADPARAGLEHAKRVCARWVEQGNVPAREWKPILERHWPDIRALLLEESDEAQRLRQTTRSAESSRPKNGGRFTGRRAMKSGAPW